LFIALALTAVLIVLTFSFDLSEWIQWGVSALIILVSTLVIMRAWGPVRVWATEGARRDHRLHQQHSAAFLQLVNQMQMQN
jgi:ABC-type nickel/cobalt efflux system permease component RcnA